MNKDKNNSVDTARKPYEKPAVISDETFETMALSCGKGNPDDCFFGPIKS